MGPKGSQLGGQRKKIPHPPKSFNVYFSLGNKEIFVFLCLRSLWRPSNSRPLFAVPQGPMLPMLLPLETIAVATVIGGIGGGGVDISL